MKHLSRLMKSAVLGLIVVVALWSMASFAAEKSATASKSVSARTSSIKSGKASPDYQRLGGLKGIENLSHEFVSELMNHSAGAAPSKNYDTGSSSAMSGSSAGTASTASSSGAATSSGKSETKTTVAGASSGGMAEATEAEVLELLQQHVTARICQAAGGACRSPEAPLSTLQGKVNATPDEWTVAMNKFRSVLADHRLSPSGQDKVMNELTRVMHEVTPQAAGH
jgi:hypothetical protein